MNLKAGGPIDGRSINPLSEEEAAPLQFFQQRKLACEEKFGEDIVN